MEKYIYKITNKINGLSYIGQAKDYKKRFADHRAMMYGRQPNKKLYKAFQQFGINNFIFEVIDYGSNYNELEKKWIKYYNSYQNGYNQTLGGEEPPVHYGEENHSCTHSDDEVKMVQNLLINTTLSSKEIGKITGYDDTAIIRINKGELRKDQNLSYPLRKELTQDFKKRRALDIIYDLQNTSLTQKEIGNKYGVGRTTVTAINRGQNHKIEGIEYPIRK